MNKLQPAAHFRKILLIKDTSDDWGRNLQVSSEQLATTDGRENISSEDLSKLDDIFWVLFMEVYRQIRRGDRYRPFTSYLYLLNTTLPKIISLLPAEVPIRHSLCRSIYDEDTAITLQFLQELLSDYLEARRSIVKNYNLDFPLDSPFEREIFKIASPR